MSTAVAASATVTGAGAAPAPPPAATGSTAPPAPHANATTTALEPAGEPGARAAVGEGTGAVGEPGSGTLRTPPSWGAEDAEYGGALGGGTAGPAALPLGDQPGLDYAAAVEGVQVQGELLALEGGWPPPEAPEVEAAPPGTGRPRALTVVVGTLALLGTLVAATARRPWVRQAVKRWWSTWTQPVRVKLHRRMGSFTRRPSAAEIFMSRMNMDRDTVRLV